MGVNERQTHGGVRHKIFSVIGVVLCIILIPILIVNLTLLVKSFTNSDDVPSLGGYMPLIVLTGSMEPEIMEGDLIICHTAEASDVKIGDVIAFFDPDGNGTSVLTHRVIEVTEENGSLSFRTQGDANDSADRLPVSADRLVGEYRFRIPGAGSVAMFMQTAPGLIVCVVLPLVLLIGYDIIRRRMHEKSKKENTDELLAELQALRAEKAAAEKSGTERSGTERSGSERSASAVNAGTAEHDTAVDSGAQDSGSPDMADKTDR